MQQTFQGLRRLMLAAVLASAFSLPAFGDEIECGVTTPPPPPSAAAFSEEEGNANNLDTNSYLIGSLLGGLLGVL